MADLKENFDNFLDQTSDERLRAEKRRDYRDLKQWTEAEAQKLRERGQAPIVFDQFAKKIDGLCGIEVDKRSDPKAYPVTPKHEKAADSITDALRYVEVKSSFDEIASEVFEDKIVEGYGGVIVEVKKVGDRLDVQVNQVHWDRIYYDPTSRRKDFKDATYMGITLWMDQDEAIARFPKKEEEITNLVGTDSSGDETFDDRPNNWVDRTRSRVRINQEYIKRGEVWMEVFYAGNVVLVEEKESPYLDSFGVPTNPIELQSDFLDRDNARYGYSERLMDVQDEINHRRSKALHMLSSKSVITELGATGGVSREEVLDELRKGMSMIEIIPGARFDVDHQQELGQTQLGFYQDAQQAMDSIGTNPELTGTTDSAISGRAFIARQQGGMVELSRIFSRHFEWKRRVYEQMWSRIKQFWTEEKWVRVTDNEDAMKFVGLNIPITAAEKSLEEKSGMSIDDLRSKAGSEQVDEIVQALIQENPQMGEVVETRNNVVEMDMDIILEEAPDTLTIQQEQFETLSQLAGARADPQMFTALLKLSTLKNKEEVLELINGSTDDAQKVQEAQQEEAAKVKQMQEALGIAQVEKTQSETAKNLAAVEVSQADIALKGAQTKDELASAIERVGKTSILGL